MTNLYDGCWVVLGVVVVGITTNALIKKVRRYCVTSSTY